MTAGSGSTGPGGAVGGAGGASPWWSDALNDPWRQPDSATVILQAAPPVAPPPAAEPTPELAPHPRADLRRTIAVAALAGLLAGGLGGAIGYAAATHQGAPAVVLGGARTSAAPVRATGSTAEVVARVMPSVVTVQGSTPRGESLGSGFVLTPDGYILTNEHVITNAPDDAVAVTLADTTLVAAHVVGRDPESDLAVLKIDRSGLQPAEFGDSDQVAVGDDVLAIGAPLALSGTVTRGIISALDRTIETRDADGVQRYYAAIQTDAAVNLGNSGGPLFDTAGRVIGINSVIKSLAEDSELAGNIGIAFAIPINQAARVATEIIRTGKAHRTVFGAQFDSSRAAGVGVRLTKVDSGGPADEAGLQSGDVVTRIGSHLVAQPSDLIALVRRYDPGSVVAVIYRRGPNTQTVSVTLVADAN